MLFESETELNLPSSASTPAVADLYGWGDGTVGNLYLDPGNGQFSYAIPQLLNAPGSPLANIAGKAIKVAAGDGAPVVLYGMSGCI